jgi:heterodisulfide reductase subunit B
LANEPAAYAAAAKVLRAASAERVDVLALSCPVCEYTLGRRQGDIRAKHEGFGEVPTLYFTQLLALALGLPADQLGLKLNEAIAVSRLKASGLIDAAAL